MAKDSFYFPHDYNARNDVKCLFLRQQLGMEGYGIFWFLVESLADAGGILPLKIIPVLAMQMQMPEVKVQAVINNFELFEITDSDFFSSRLNVHLELRQLLSDKGRQGAIKRHNLAVKVSPPNSPPNGDAYAKERKGKEIKGKEIKESKGAFAPPSQIVVQEFLMTEKNMDEFTASGFACTFWNFYESKGWMVGKNKMKVWKSAVNTWLQKNKNESYSNRTSGTGGGRKISADEARANF